MWFGYDFPEMHAGRRLVYEDNVRAVHLANILVPALDGKHVGIPHLVQPRHLERGEFLNCARFLRPSSMMVYFLFADAA